MIDEGRISGWTRSAALLRGCGWLIFVALSVLIVKNTLPYYDGGHGHAFLLEKGDLAGDARWRTAFFAHLTGSMICLLTGPLLLSGRLLRRRVEWHRWLGRVYVGAVLAWAGPSGLVLAFHAKGGAWGRTGFLLLGVLWLASTALGYHTVRRRRMEAHVRWMVRSYALAASAVTFRIIQLAGHHAGVADEPNYIAALWLSLTVSVVGAELMLHARRQTTWSPGALWRRVTSQSKGTMS